MRVPPNIFAPPFSGSAIYVFLVFLGLARRQRKNAPVAERSGEFLEPGVSRSKPE